ncbi:MAG: WG repeat-containing protein [Defluviitaleaceae bacterium]|nr:WG repeat-containing protein [Defluviitaleaceae bacterium]
MIRRKIVTAICILILAFVAINTPTTATSAQDINVRMIMEPSLEADFVYPFSGGMAAVRTVDSTEGDFRLGYVNRYGQFIIPYRSYPPLPHWHTPAFSHGLVSVYDHEGGLMGFFDTSGAIVIPFLYDRPLGSPLEFAEGFAAVSNQGLWGFIDENGRAAIPFEFERAGHFYGGHAPVMQNGRWGFVNTRGEFAIPFVLDNYSGETEDNIFINPNFSEALAPFLLTVAGGYRWGFLNLEGNRIPSDLYVHVEGFNEGRALVMQEDEDYNQLFGFISRDGVEVIPLIYSYAYSFAGGLAAVRLNARWGFIDHYGSVQVPIGYDNARSFSEGFAAVRTGDSLSGRWGFIDRWSNEVVPLVYYEVQDFADGLAAVRTGDGHNARWGFVDRNGRIVVPIQYLEVQSFSEGLAWVRGPGGWGILAISQDGEEDGPAAADSRYIHQDTPANLLFTPPAGALESVYDAISADEVIFRTMRGFTPEQRGSGDALNIAALFVENAIRRGTTQSIPGDSALSADILQASANIGESIWQDALNTVANENINLMRPPGLNINFTSQERDRVSVAFPNDISGIAFDNITIESGFASVSLYRGHVPRESEIVMERGVPMLAGTGGLIPFTDSTPASYSASFFVDFISGFNLRGIISDDFSLRGIINAPLDYLREFWAVPVIIFLIILWIVLGVKGHKFRLWVVPAFSILALVANGWMLGMFSQDDHGFALAPGYFHSVTVTMSPGMRATLSIPINGANPDLLVLFNEDNEPMLSKHNPVTDTIDARIKTSGTYRLLEHGVNFFADIEDLSPQAQHAITRLAAMGIMRPIGDSFRPGSAVTRAEFISAVVIAFDMVDMYVPNHFLDNEPGDWYYQAIAAAANLGLVHGFEDGNFRGSWAITKNDLVFAIAGALTSGMGYHSPADVQAILAPYSDRDTLSPWAQPSIALATAANVLPQRDDGLFAPDSVMARGDAAVLVYRLLGRLW